MGKRNKGKKKPVRRKSPEPEKKTPRGAGKPLSYEQSEIVWHFRVLDFNGPWGWNENTLSSKDLVETIHGSIVDFETMTWESIKSNGSHNVSLDQLCKAARDRLSQIEQNDIDELFSLRLTGRRRIWGIRDRNILKVLWWDPKHQVCPSPKKHT